VDILPLHTARNIRTNQHLSPTAPWLLALLGLPFLGLLGMATVARRERFAGTAAGEERRRRAAGKAAVREAERAGKEGDADAATTALRAYLVARLGPAGAALGDGEAATVLQAEGVSAEVASALAQLLRRIEDVRYGGASSDGLGETISDWVSRCEGDWR